MIFRTLRIESNIQTKAFIVKPRPGSAALLCSGAPAAHRAALIEVLIQRAHRRIRGSVFASTNYCRYPPGGVLLLLLFLHPLPPAQLQRNPPPLFFLSLSLSSSSSSSPLQRVGPPTERIKRPLPVPLQQVEEVLIHIHDNTNNEDEEDDDDEADVSGAHGGDARAAEEEEEVEEEEEEDALMVRAAWVRQSGQPPT